MRFVLQFLKPYWMLLMVILLTVVLDVVGALLVPTITADMINIGVGDGDLDQIVHKGIMMLAVSIITGLSVLVGSWFCAKLSANMGRDMRNAIYNKSLTFSASDFEKFGTGSMITRTLSDITVIQQAFIMFIQMVLPVPIMCILGVVFAFHINRSIGFLIMGFMIFVMLVATIIVKKAAPIFEKMQGYLDRMNVVLRENITGVRVIRAFNNENQEKKRLKKSFSDYAESAIRANRLFAALDSLAMLSVNLCIVVILYLGGNYVGSGTMAIGDITAVTEYAIWILFYIIMAQMVIILIPKAHICQQRISDVLSFTPTILDGKNMDLSNANMEQEVIRFENATFRFADADEDTLSNLSFSCMRGTTTAIIGGTGSGKSTIAKLLLRYHDVTSGQIFLKNNDIRKLTQHTLRDGISYVPQKAWLFSGTIADNLKYGNPNASEEEMRHTLCVTQAEFVFGLSDGLNSYVAQGGTNFSGGQKQRLSIARALMKKSDLYIFDDSFSALDFKTDAALRKALVNETKDAAVLIIAQRISTIQHADQIIVLDDGKIAGIGTHDYLMKQCPVYRDIAQSQMKGGGINGK